MKKPQYPPIGWKAWYTSGRVYDSRSISWKDLPSEGVLVVKIYNPGGRSALRCGVTLYWLHHFPDGDWTIACDNEADARIPEGTREAGLVKEGRWATEREIAAAIDEAAHAVWE